MIKVSTRSTYAVRAMVDLARSSTSGHPERLGAIAERQQIPLPYLEQIFSKLKKAGLVQAVRGPQGGYLLNRSPDAITLGDIVTVLEGPLEPVLCSHPQNRHPQCHEVDGCASRAVCNELDGQLNQVLSRNTLATLAGETDRLKTNEGRLPINIKECH
jgi:Rrf2 family protein